MTKKRRKISRLPGIHTARPPVEHQPGGTVRLTAISWEDVAAQRPLRFPPPLAECFSNRSGLSYWWRQIQYVFDFDDPACFGALPATVSFSDHEVEVLRRYAAAARVVASSSVLNSSSKVTVHIADDNASEIVEADFTAADVEAGFAVRFRQLYATDESASFHKAHAILTRHLRNSPEHADGLQKWRAAAGILRSKSVARLAVEKLITEGVAPPDPDLNGYPDPRPPEQTISQYFYGEHIHRDGEKAKVIDARKEDPFEDAWERMNFLRAAGGLAHIYAGFAALVERVLAEAETRERVRPPLEDR